MIGTRIAHYEITAKLGEGGMGEVYRATDTKLHRDVALKILPEQFAIDAQRMGRFQREAEVLASLDHPNIGAIYGIEDAGESKALVLQLIEGPTLADRIAQGPIPVEEALPIALQITEALEAAHEKGIIHRDLKPANVKITPEGQVKVLDFGLAKAFIGDQADVNLSNSPTLSMQATQAGVILGTAAYMSPEQTRGREVDKRTDIWAFGCVLYEMLTGRSAFQGEDATEILASVIKTGANLELLPANIHPTVSQVLSRCLEKDTKKRFRDIGDVRFELEMVSDDPNGVMRQPDALSAVSASSHLPWIAGMLFAAVVAATVGWYSRPLVRAPNYQFSVNLAADLKAYEPFSISPDGLRLVYPTSEQLFLQDMEQLEARPLAGTEGGGQPFFSPDGDWVAFFTDTQLKKISLASGEVREVATVDGGLIGVWDERNRIVFGRKGPSGLFEVDANGGVPQLFAELGEYADLDYPQMLPGGEWVIFTALVTGYTDWDSAQIIAQEVATGERKVVHDGGHFARYVPTGHLLYTQYRRLFAIPFNHERVETIGEPFQFAQSISADNQSAGNARFAVALDAGTLVFMPAASEESRLALVDRDGTIEVLEDLPALPYVSPRFSPDGNQLVVQTSPNNGESEIWLYGFSGETGLNPLPEQQGESRRPIWTPDGNSITFASNRGGTWGIYSQPADRRGEAEPLLMAEGGRFWPDAWANDGSTLAFTDAGLGTWRIRFFDSESRQISALLDDTVNTMLPEFSSSGEWLAYGRNESGLAWDWRVYAKQYPSGLEYEIGRLYGQGPVWGLDDEELFYARLDNIWEAEVVTEPTFAVPNEAELPIAGQVTAGNYRNYDFAPVRNQFVIVLPPDSTQTQPQVNVIVNWFEELKERVPVP